VQWTNYPFVGLVVAFLVLEAALVGFSRMLARRGPAD
jgi:hypothetical protein